MAKMKRMFPNGRVLTWELNGYSWILIARNWQQPTATETK
jgi:hypothetical protein